MPEVVGEAGEVAQRVVDLAGQVADGFFAGVVIDVDAVVW